MSWLAVIKLGKVRVIARLNKLGIVFPEKLNYFKLCSLLYQYLKSISNWLMVVKMAGEPWNLTAELQSLYERKATIHSREGKRLGRIWFSREHGISYDRSSWAQWRVAKAQTYSEALAVIGG